LCQDSSLRLEFSITHIPSSKKASNIQSNSRPCCQNGSVGKAWSKRNLLVIGIFILERRQQHTVIHCSRGDSIDRVDPEEKCRSSVMFQFNRSTVSQHLVDRKD